MSRAKRLAATRAWFGRVLAGVTQARTLGLAAEMSFWVFLALVPLAAVAGLVAARVATTHQSAAISLLSSVPAPLRDLVGREVANIAAWRGGAVAPAATVTFVWLASSGMQAVLDAIEVQSGTSRPWWKKRLLAIGACIALSAGAALLALLAAGLDWIAAPLGRTLPAGLVAVARGPVAHALRYALAVLLAVAMVAGLYRIGIPREACARVRVFPGALFAVFLQAVLVWGYGVYLGKIGTGGAYQAGLSLVGLTMMTLWLSSLALLLGVELNRVLGESHRRSHESSSMAERSGSKPRAWPASAGSSSPPTSLTPPSAPSTGPSSSPRA